MLNSLVGGIEKVNADINAGMRYELRIEILFIVDIKRIFLQDLLQQPQSPG
jgi:hypothetical protein